MPLKKYFLLIFLVTIFLAPTYGQDFHYTQYFMSPLGVNPALAGAYNGSYRINGIYRDQFRGAALKPFTGFSLNVDAPIIRGIRKQDWIGVGFRMESASAGGGGDPTRDALGVTTSALGQTLNFYGLGVAYHLALDKKQNSVFTLGAQYGTGGYAYNQLQEGDTGRSITATTGGLSEQEMTFNGTEQDVSGGSLNDLTVGVLYNLKNPKAGSDLKLGFAVEGILNPNRSARRTDNKGIGLNGYGAYEFAMGKRASLTSGLYYYSNKQASAIIVNSIYNYKIKPEDKMTLHGGLGLRNARAALIYLGMTFSGVRVGLGYDLDIGASTPTTNNHKSIELGVTYIGKIYKKPKPKPIIYCPRL